MTTHAAAAASVPQTAPRRASGPGRIARQCLAHQSYTMRHQPFTRPKNGGRVPSDADAAGGDISGYLATAAVLQKRGHRGRNENGHHEQSFVCETAVMLSQSGVNDNSGGAGRRVELERD